MQLHHNDPYRQLTENGTLIYSSEQAPLSVDEWDSLRKLIEHADFDHVVGGDANEMHSVHVARFVNDVDRPRSLSPLTDDIKQIVMSEKMREFYSGFTGTSELCLRRCQANRLEQGDYIGIHKDQDSNPHYIATVVFHFDTDYEGGDFVTYDNGGESRHHPQPFSLLVNNCEVPHEVTPVCTGKRLTLACFLSQEFGDSPVRREPIKLSH
jgi:hypothetical protein